MTLRVHCNSLLAPAKASVATLELAVRASSGNFGHQSIAVATTTVAAAEYSGCDTTAAAAVQTAAAVVSVAELPAGVTAALADPADCS